MTIERFSLRVLHVISGLDPQNGGPTMALLGMVRALHVQGVDVSVLATWKEMSGLPVAEGLRTDGIPVRHVGPAKGKFSSHPQLKSAAQETIEAVDLVHIHAMWEDAQHVAARTAQRLGKPYLITPHGMLDPWNMSKSRLLKRLHLLLRSRRNLQRASCLHFATELERDAVSRLQLKPHAIVEPWGLNRSEFEVLPRAGLFASKYPDIGAAPYVVFLGRVHPGKGVEVLIPAFARSAPAEWRLVIAGPDSQGYRAQMERLAHAHGVAQRTIFTGMLVGQDRLTALHDAQLMALPSCHENFGIAVAEALACGTPALMSNQVYLHPLITRAGVGAASALNVEAFSSLLAKWTHDADLRASAAVKARAFALEQFDWDRIASRWVEHYRQCAHPAERLS